MDVPGFARLLKQQNMDSEVWWDSAPTAYPSFKNTLIEKYPDTFDYIEQLLPDDFASSPSGISGATTNPRLVAQEIARDPQHWRDFIGELRADVTDPDQADSARAGRLYDQVIEEGARLLRPLWVSSRGAQGWVSAQVDGGERMNAEMLIARGRHLARLAPNVMVKIPGSEQGYRAIEALIAQGCSVNNTFCFTVSQVHACLKAIHRGRLSARLKGVNTDRARYVISFMIGRLGAEAEFERQAQQCGIRLRADDRRWAELAVYQAIQALLQRRPSPARLLLCSLNVHTRVRGREECWHLQRTGADTTLYTLTPAIIEFLVRRQQQGRPVLPATEGVKVPRQVMNRLMGIAYFNQAYFLEGQAPSAFASHPAFVTASANARKGYEQLLAFVTAGAMPASGFSFRAASRPVMESLS